MKNNNNKTDNTKIQMTLLSVNEEVKYLDSINRDLKWADVIYVLKSFIDKANKEEKRHTKFSYFTYTDKKGNHVTKRKEVKSEDFNKDTFIITLWELLENQYHITEKLSNLINFTKLFGPFVGNILNLMKKRAIKAIIVYIIIPVISGLLFKK